LASAAGYEYRMPPRVLGTGPNSPARAWILVSLITTAGAKAAVRGSPLTIAGIAATGTKAGWTSITAFSMRGDGGRTCEYPADRRDLTN
jgi:hypothetical protein